MNDRNGFPSFRHPPGVVHLVCLVAAALGLLALGLSAAPASAAPASSEIVPYGFAHVSDSEAGAMGAVFSERKRCEGDRKLKMIVRSGNGKRALDAGKTSREGAWGLVGPASEIEGAGKIIVVVSRVVRGGTECARDRVQLPGAPPLRASDQGASLLRARAKPAKSKVRPLYVNGAGDDGAVFGVVESKRPRCERGRTVKLLSLTASGEIQPLDRARTSRGGGWAGHVTAHEDGDTARYVAVLKRKKYKRGGKRRVCAGDRGSLSRLIITRGSSRPW